MPKLKKNPDTGKPYQTGTSGSVLNHGYAILKLGATSGKVRYYEVPGDGSSRTSTLLFEEDIS